MNRILGIAIGVAIVTIRLAFLGSASAEATMITLPDGWAFEPTPSGLETYAQALPESDFDVTTENISVVTEALPSRMPVSDCEAEGSTPPVPGW